MEKIELRPGSSPCFQSGARVFVDGIEWPDVDEVRIDTKAGVVDIRHRTAVATGGRFKVEMHSVDPTQPPTDVTDVAERKATE